MFQTNYSIIQLIDNLMKETQKLKVVSKYVYNSNDALGFGTWGTVYKAQSTDANDKKLYALKKMNKFKVQSLQGSFQKYQNEVIALQRAKNIPQVIQFIDFFKSKSNYYIVTEYCEGSQDLYSYMNRNPRKFTQSQARQIFKNVLTGVLELHNLNICHRDIKLQNILYIPYLNEAKVIDFGLAVCLNSLEGEKSQSKVGSPLFMSPQVLTEEPYTKKCDIWSLGILFYYMICRVSPYGDNPSHRQILQGMKRINQNGVEYGAGIYVSKSCKQIIQGCLKWKQSHRAEIKDLLAMEFFNKSRQSVEIKNQETVKLLKQYNFKSDITFKN